MRWILFLLLLGVWGCGKSKPAGPAPLPKVSFEAQNPALPGLAVLDQPGFWKMDTEFVEFNPTNNAATTNRSTATTHVNWALKGHVLLLETEINSDPKGYELVVKNFDTTAKTNQYRCTWIHDDGLVRGYAGNWLPKQARMDWEPIYLPGGQGGLQVKMADVFTSPTVKTFQYHMAITNKPLASGLFKATRQPAVPGRKVFAPAEAMMKKLGKAGTWHETQSLMEGGAVKQLRSVSRMRWARGGKILINEGMTNPNGDKELFMWIKTWDRVGGVYRWVYIWEDGHVDHYIGYWDAPKQLITWQAIFPGVVIELREMLAVPNQRSWSFEVHAQDGILSTGSGTSTFNGN